MKRFPILLNNKKYSTDFQTLPEFAKGWRTVLTKAHGGVGYCLCKPLSPDLRKISIKFKEATDLYSLARFGNTESEHDPECRFAQEYSEQSRQIPSTGSNTGIEKTKDSVLVKFHIGIIQQRNYSPAPAPPPHRLMLRASGASQSNRSGCCNFFGRKLASISGIQYLKVSGITLTPFRDYPAPAKTFM